MNSAALQLWQATGASVRGASHLRVNLPNQDAIAMDVPAVGGDSLIVCVSDGHGSPKCFRSDTGSRFVAEVAIEVTREFASGLRDASPTEIKRAAETWLPREIVSKWRRRVADHILANPFEPSELEFLGNVASPAQPEDLVHRNEYFLAYGATVVLVAVLEACIISLQLGDGDILCVSADGQFNAPIIADPELIANETTSICMPKAPALFRTRFQMLQDGGPALIMVSTDGYSNAFASTEGFHQSGSDLLRIIERSGLATVQGSLPSWLDASSRDGSGDDVSLGIIWRPSGTAGFNERVNIDE